MKTALFAFAILTAGVMLDLGAAPNAAAQMAELDSERVSA